MEIVSRSLNNFLGKSGSWSEGPRLIYATSSYYYSYW